MFSNRGRDLIGGDGDETELIGAVAAILNLKKLLARTDELVYDRVSLVDSNADVVSLPTVIDHQWIMHE